MASQTQVRLLTVPRTAFRRTQFRHDLEQVLYRRLFFHFELTTKTPSSPRISGLEFFLGIFVPWWFKE
jgi:hypothetical protein